MKNDKVLALLGLGRRAGKADSGEFAVENAIKKRKACLCLIAEDASENTKKKFKNMCSYRKVDVFEHGTLESLGKAVGCGPRAVASINDKGLAESAVKALELIKSQI